MSTNPETSGEEPVSLLGTMLGSYRIIERIGSGAMGSVYRGFDVHSGADVALKVLNESTANEAVFCERLKREAEAVIAIDHPNIVKVHAFGFSLDGLPFMTMELLRGKTLDDVIVSSAPLEWRRAGHIIREIAVGLAAAHGKGFIHRDLKPGNVMVLNPGEPMEQLKVLDFGIVAVVGDPRGRLTNDGLVLGTPVYMAPEQLMSSNVDHRADLYALGIMLFELLSGQPPFEGCFREVAARHLLTPPGPLPVSGGLEQIAYKLLAKDKRERFQTAVELVTELDRVLFVEPAAESEIAFEAPVEMPRVISTPAAPMMSLRAQVAQTRVRRRFLPPASHRGWVHAGAASMAASVVICALVAFRDTSGPQRYEVQPLPELAAVTVTTATPVEIERKEPTEPQVQVVSAIVQPVAPAPSPRAMNKPTAPKEEPEPTYADANERLRRLSATLVSLAKSGTVGDISGIEEEYLDLSTELEAGRDASHYRRIIARIDTLERDIAEIQ